MDNHICMSIKERKLGERGPGEEVGDVEKKTDMKSRRSNYLTSTPSGKGARRTRIDEDKKKQNNNNYYNNNNNYYYYYYIVTRTVDVVGINHIAGSTSRRVRHG